MRPLSRTFATVVISMSLVSASFLLLEVKNVLAATDYTFGTENIVKGYSVNPTNKNAEDATYNTLIEGDQYADDNYSGSSENVVVGTGGGGAFSSSLDTDDATRRTYTEADSAPGDTTNTLVPTSDVSVGFDATYPTSPTTHYDKVDEGASHDSAATYNRAITNADRDEYGLTDMADPTGTYDLDVTIYVIEQDTSTGTAYFDAGIVLSSTSYVGINDQAAQNAWTSHEYTWEANPAGGEWTYSVINGMNVFVEVYDAAPDVDVTSVYIVVSIDYTASYTLDAQVTYSSVTSSSQTTNFMVFCQGYRNVDTENVKVQAWNYTSSAWVDKATISAGSDTDYNFNLLGWAANCERSSGNEVKLRLVDVSGGDATQTVTYLDVLKVNRMEKGYASSVELTSTTVSAHGNITLRIKGYTSAETWQVDVYNYTSAAYDTAKLTITSLSNAWQTTVDLCDDHHRSGTSAKIRLVDTTAEASDIVQDTFYLDVAWITQYYTDPTITSYTAYNIEIAEGEDAIVWCTYTDYDNQAPTYVRVHVDASYYAMAANDSDTDYFDGKLYGKTITGLAVGVWDYWFAVDDAESSEVATAQVYTITVAAAGNNAPEFISTATDAGHNNTLYYYDANAEDAELDPLTFDLEGSIEAFATINPTTGVVQGTPTVVGDYWMNVSVTDGISTVWQNTSIHIYTDAPSFDTPAITTWQNGTTYTYTAQASDPEAEGLTFHLEGNGTSFVSMTPAGSHCELEGAITSMGWWYLNLSVTDGTNTVWQNWTLTALNSAPYFTFEAVLTGMTNVSYVCQVIGDDNNSDELIYSIDSSNSDTKAWLTLNYSTLLLEGVPTVNGSYDVNLSVTDGLITSWYNFTITVDLNDADTVSVLALILALSFCTLLLAAGFKERSIWILAGPCWMLCGILVFLDYGDAFMMMSVGLGLFLMIKGAYDVAT